MSTVKGLSLAFLIPILLLSTCLSSYQVLKPKKGTDFKQVSVQIVTDRISGSGTIIRSSKSGSEFLTNAHVCNQLKESGGSVMIGDDRFEATDIKPWSKHDLCIVRIQEDLHIGVQVAAKAPELGDPIMVAGHPLAMPLVIQSGFASEVFNIAEGSGQELLLLTSVIVQPGSSGSGVFNAEGELIGVIEAFKFGHQRSEIGFGLAVPQSFVHLFVDQESKSMKWIEVPHDQ